MKRISVTMKLFFWEKFHCDLKGLKTCRFKSLRFDFCVINFDTMKFILIAKVLKILVPSHFWQKRKGTQVSYQYLRSNMVETEGIEASLRSFASQTFRILCRLRLCLTANRRNIDGGVRSPLAICKTNKKLQTFSFAVFLLVETEGIEPPTSRMWTVRSDQLSYASVYHHINTPLKANGPSDRIRTCGLMVPNHARYQLRYTRI